MKIRKAIGWVALSAAALLGTGCAAMTKEQYFMALEPDTGERAMYKLTLKITGWGASKYKLTSGYVPANVVDALSGNLREPADLYAPQPASEARAKAQSVIREKLAFWLQQLATSPAAYDRENITEIVDWYGALWAGAALDDNELISIGQQGTGDPYGFRKLVFFASTEVVPIGRFTAQLDAIEKAAVDLADAIKQARAASAAARQARADKIAARRRRMLEYVQKKPDMTKWTGLDFLQMLAIAEGVTE